jgi:hypothetical protein
MGREMTKGDGLHCCVPPYKHSSCLVLVSLLCWHPYCCCCTLFHSVPPHKHSSWLLLVSLLCWHPCYCWCALFHFSLRPCMLSLLLLLVSLLASILAVDGCAAGFALLNLPKGKSLGRSKPATNSYAQALATHCVGFLLYPSSAELPYAK